MSNIMEEVRSERQKGALIAVMGVGGAGGNAVNRMYKEGIEGVTFMVCNTDSQALHNSRIECKIQLGRDGLGAGNDPERGAALARETLDDIRQALQESGARMLFITAGMGGGTGTGASPVIAQLAQEMGLLTVAIVTSPLALEGANRYKQAQLGIERLRQYVDSLLIINNENIHELYGHLSLKQAFGKADEVLSLATKGIAEIITVESDLVNVDFADVEKVMRNSGRAHMAVASATGENRAVEAASATLDSPLLDHNQIKGAKNILLNISVSGEEELIYNEVLAVLNFVQTHASVRDENGVVQTANIIWGNSVKPQLGDAIEVVLVATGFAGEQVDVNDAMTRILREPDIIPIETQPKKSEPQSVLEPLKPVQPATPAQNEAPVVLGTPPNRYGSRINKLLETPSYVTRNAQFIVQTTKSRKEVVHDESLEGPQSSDTVANGALNFGDDD